MAGPSNSWALAKRNTTEDEDNERDYRNPRHRSEAPPGTRIKRNLLDIAEDVNGRPPRDTKEQALHIAKLTAEHWDDEYVRETFGTVIMKLWVKSTPRIRSSEYWLW
jgi:nuclear cap-binding protein subunit 1